MLKKSSYQFSPLAAKVNVEQLKAGNLSLSSFSVFSSSPVVLHRLWVSPIIVTWVYFLKKTHNLGSTGKACVFYNILRHQWCLCQCNWTFSLLHVLKFSMYLNSSPVLCSTECKYYFRVRLRSFSGQASIVARAGILNC